MTGNTFTLDWKIFLTQRNKNGKFVATIISASVAPKSEKKKKWCGKNMYLSVIYQKLEQNILKEYFLLKLKPMCIYSINLSICINVTAYKIGNNIILSIWMPSRVKIKTKKKITMTPNHQQKAKIHSDLWFIKT